MSLFVLHEKKGGKKRSLFFLLLMWNKLFPDATTESLLTGPGTELHSVEKLIHYWYCELQHYIPHPYFYDSANVFFSFFPRLFINHLSFFFKYKYI